ncbi:hypothetical protein F5Y12DRAFT_719760 [Xylaria sp. FL1777]|nr:hypothetical protein F5Y12DRAFT_719760 [Xylaria sp. FL1777]
MPNKKQPAKNTSGSQAPSTTYHAENPPFASTSYADQFSAPLGFQYAGNLSSHYLGHTFETSPFNAPAQGSATLAPTVPDLPHPYTRSLDLDPSFLAPDTYPLSLDAANNAPALSPSTSLPPPEMLQNARLYQQIQALNDRVLALEQESSRTTKYINEWCGKVKAFYEGTNHTVAKLLATVSEALQKEE